MTMFTLPNFCRVCLKYDKNLIDLAHIENEPSETLMSKLQLCVSEVEWSVYKPLLCHPCIKRLNIAYGFKKQCVQSAGVLKNYVELVKESQKKNESQALVKCENVPQGGAYMLLPNQKYVKILVGSQNQGNTFQNVFLNLIPTTTLNAVPTDGTTTPKSKDTNQNVFLNLNNTFQKYVPIAPSDSNSKKSENVNVNVNQLLTETKTEEVSVEIDPTDFTGLEEDDEDSSGNEDDTGNDWDEMISPSKIDSKDMKDSDGSLNGDTFQNGKQCETQVKNIYGNYVPILPKHDDFLNSGQHFLSPSFDNLGDFVCEACQKNFSSIKLLKQHIKLFHLGKLPFKCEYCYAEFVLRSDYDTCMERHKHDSNASSGSLTLQDFAISMETPQQTEANVSSGENGEYMCDICRRPFNSSTGLLRHKVRKHNQKNKKKYFIKGMKNARCDICNREFSTQSYMQLHRKLHLRDDIGYKYKVFGKSKYDGKNKDKANDVPVVKEEEAAKEMDEVVDEKKLDDDGEDRGEDSDSQDQGVKENKENNKMSDSSNNDCGDDDDDKMVIDINEDNSDESDEGMSDEN